MLVSSFIPVDFQGSLSGNSGICPHKVRPKRSKTEGVYLRSVNGNANLAQRFNEQEQHSARLVWYTRAQC